MMFPFLKNKRFLPERNSIISLYFLFGIIHIHLLWVNKLLFLVILHLCVGPFLFMNPFLAELIFDLFYKNLSTCKWWWMFNFLISWLLDNVYISLAVQDIFNMSLSLVHPFLYFYDYISISKHLQLVFMIWQYLEFRSFSNSLFLMPLQGYLLPTFTGYFQA